MPKPIPKYELLPCPFCGGAVSIDDPEAYERGIGFLVGCEPCYVSMWAFHGEHPYDLAARWNSRKVKV